MLYIDIKLKVNTITCGAIYRLPFRDAKSHCSFVKSLQENLNKINKKNCFLFGDFNFNLLHPDKQNTSNFADAPFEFGFIPLISKPIRISHCCATLLDHIWTNSCIHHKLNTATLAKCLSDHLPVMMCMPTRNIRIACNKSYCSFSEARIKSFSKALTLIDISTIKKKTIPKQLIKSLKTYLWLNWKISFLYKSLAKTKVIKADLILNYKSY